MKRRTSGQSRGVQAVAERVRCTLIGFGCERRLSLLAYVGFVGDEQWGIFFPVDPKNPGTFIRAVSVSVVAELNGVRRTGYCDEWTILE